MEMRKTQRNKNEALAAARNSEVRMIEAGQSKESSAQEFEDLLGSYNAKLIRNDKEEYWAVYVPGHGYSIRTSRL